MEEDNEWETIQPSSSSTSITHSDEDDGDTVVITNPNYQTTPLNPQPIPQQLSPTSSFSSSSSSEITPEELPHPTEMRITLLSPSLKFLSSWVLRVCVGIRSRIGYLSIVAFVTVTAYAWRWNRLRKLREKESRDKMLLLINQKDEKIKQLLLQIDRMNEALSGRRRVPVVRIMVDSPLVLSPRSNWKSN